MSKHYIVISSDSHAGLQCEQYRPYLDPSVMPEFDEYVAERHKHRQMQLEINSDYIEKWEKDNEIGLTGAWDPVQRDKELDHDGVAGEVVFADADAVTGQESPPFGAGLAAGRDHDATNSWLLCSPSHFFCQVPSSAFRS